MEKRWETHWRRYQLPGQRASGNRQLAGSHKMQWTKEKRDHDSSNSSWGWGSLPLNIPSFRMKSILLPQPQIWGSVSVRHILMIPTLQPKVRKRFLVRVFQNAPRFPFGTPSCIDVFISSLVGS
jgi:hypothetical protein